jgi:hypothetical protein
MHGPDMTSALQQVLGVNVAEAASHSSGDASQRVNDALAQYVAHLDVPM